MAHRQSPNILAQLKPWLEPVATVAMLVAAIFAAVAANHAAISAESAELQATSSIGVARPYLSVEAATFHIRNEDPSQLHGVTVTIQNAGSHPARNPTIEFALVNRDLQQVSEVQVQAPAIDILGGHSASATFGQLDGAALGDTYLVIRMTYSDPILDSEAHGANRCFAYEPLATDANTPTAAACTQDEALAVMNAAFAGSPSAAA